MIPSAELTAAVMKLACFGIAHAGMEIHTVPGQVFVLGFRIADTGIEVQNPHLFQGIFQRPVQLSADPLFFPVSVDIDRGFRRPVIGRPAHKRTRIGIAHNFSVQNRHKIGVFFQCIFHSPSERPGSGNLIFKGNGGIPDIVLIYGQYILSVFENRGTDQQVSAGISGGQRGF